MSTVESWIERAEYDIDTARAMLDSGRYLYVMFCCQQSVEKALKALIIHQTGELAPRIHNLTRLADLAGIDPDDEQKTLMEDLSGYYIQTRYPEEMEAAGKGVGHEDARRYFQSSKGMVQWLVSTLK